MNGLEFVNGKYIGKVDGKVVVETTSKYYAEKKLQQLVGEVQTSTVEPVSAFPINQRFEFVGDLVTMVASGMTPSTIITGEGGLGKTFSVLKALKDAGMSDVSELDPGSIISSRSSFRVVKGYSTAKGLYRTLYENQKSILVFDDCDSILKDAEALNILKGALDSFDKRIITWNTSRDDPDLPRSFQFYGGVIFISNLSMQRIDQAIRSRSMCVDLSMTTDQKLERMAVIVGQEDFLPQIAKKYKLDALELVNDLKQKAKEISLRTLIGVTKIRATGKSNWKSLAEYMLIQG